MIFLAVFSREIFNKVSTYRGFVTKSQLLETLYTELIKGLLTFLGGCVAKDVIVK